MNKLGTKCQSYTIILILPLSELCLAFAPDLSTAQDTTESTGLGSANDELHYLTAAKKNWLSSNSIIEVHILFNPNFIEFE